MIRPLDEVNLCHAFPEVAFSEDYIIGTYQVRVKTGDVEKLALAIADEQTTGTWIKVAGDPRTRSAASAPRSWPSTRCRLRADRVEDLPPLYIIQIAFPDGEHGRKFTHDAQHGVRQHLRLRHAKWIDVAFPKKYVEQFQGPVGVQGLRDALGVADRPLLNAMIKPNIGHARRARIFYQAARA